jgi:HEPN domain-containing protein
LVDSVQFNEWFKMAQKDIKSARILFEHEADYEIVCFHCQQAVEKYLKGYLIYLTGELQEGHSLIKLCKKVMSHEESFGDYIKDMAFINTFYIETRYPATDPFLVSKADTEECLRIVEAVTTKINRLME